MDKIKHSVNDEQEKKGVIQPFTLFLNNIRNKCSSLQPKLIKQGQTALKNVKFTKHIAMLNSISKIYVNNYIKRYLHREIVFIGYKQAILLEKSKTNKNYLLPLIKFLETMYKKKVTFNIVDLKYVYHSSTVLSQALVIKLRKKIKPVRLLKTSLNMFNIPAIDRLAVYDDMYRKKRSIQNLNMKNFVSNNFYNTNLDKPLDLLEQLLNYNFNLNKFSKSVDSLNEIMGLVKHKFTNGIRIEVAGRLTKRNTAERSIYKLRYKGNIKNEDSSYRGLSTVLLRGHAKSNLQYTQSKSKLRIGSFGLKT